MKLKFKREDFYDCGPAAHPGGVEPSEIADAANKRLAEMLAAAPMVKKVWETGQWTEQDWDDRFCTYTAKLVCIEDIKK